MKTTLVRLATFLFLMSVTTGVAFGGEVRVKLPKGGGTLVLNVPKSWKEEVSVPGPNQPPTITLTPKDGPRFEMRLTPIWQPGLVMSKPSAKEIHAVVQAGADKRKSLHAPQQLTVHDFVGPKIFGSYFSQIQDVPLFSESYEYVTQGALSVQELRVAFSIMNNDDAPTTVETAMKLLKSLRHE